VPTLTEKPRPSKQIKPRRNCPYVKDSFDSKKCYVDVEFLEGLSTEQVTANISQLSNPQVLIWYVGCYGLREAGVQFYKNFLISPVFKQNTEATFWLVDLTAWGAFKSLQCSIHSFSSYCEKIEGFSNESVKCIKSATIFRKMEEMSEKDLVSYFRKALQRSFISRPSKDFPNKNIRTKEILSDTSPMISDWCDHDVSKSYSAFQYLEGCLLVDEIFMQEAYKGASDIQIVFALPNDEIKYYKDKENSFRKDVVFLISKRCATMNIKNIRLQIKFLAFKYGAHLTERPYNARGKTLKNGNLSYEDVVGSLNYDNHAKEELNYASSLS